MRRFRVSPSLVLALIAVVLSVTGTAVAAKLITGRQIKDGSISSKDLSKALRKQLAKAGVAGPPGTVGAKGDPGPKGDPGVAGASGASGAAVFAGAATGLPAAPSGVTAAKRAAVNGESSTGNTPADIAALSPNRRIRVRDLSADIVNDVPAGGTVTVQFVAHAPGDYSDGPPPAEQVECTIFGTSGSDDRRCSGTTSVEVQPGSVIFVRIVVTGGSMGATTSPSAAHWGMTVEPA